jgi:hypothetical protein
VRNARALAEGLMAGGMRLVSGGTDSHLMLVDLEPVGVTGKEAERLLDEVGITVNKNTLPFDNRPLMVTSGIRIGVPRGHHQGHGGGRHGEDSQDHNPGPEEPRWRQRKHRLPERHRSWPGPIPSTPYSGRRGRRSGSTRAV